MKSPPGIRPGEELDVAAMDAWLKPRHAGLTGAPRVTPYSGGASNWTYRLEYESDDLVLRRPPAGTKAKSAHDMGREFRVQKALRPVYPFVPEMIAFCDDPAVIGSDFYVMRRIPGLIPRARLPEGLVLDAQAARALCLRVVDRLVDLHRVVARAAGLENLGKGAGYVRRQIEGWTARYGEARTWNVPRFLKIIAWLQAHVPEDSGTCAIHNDFRLDNLVLDPDEPTRVVGVLDWEMATLGDPLTDVALLLTYHRIADLELGAGVSTASRAPGFVSRDDVVARYGARSDRDLTHLGFYEALACFKLAVILEGIHYRHVHGQTVGDGFSQIGSMVEPLLALGLDSMKEH